MKRTPIVAAMLLAGLVDLQSPASAQVSLSISFGDFYSSLGPYGDWVYIDDGVYAWRPGLIVQGWRPYACGRWVWSVSGWYWVSDEPWSWAVYHYGRWHDDEYHGWIWIPGYDWAPAWVEWRYGPDYIGWAPLGPYALFSVDRGVYYSQAYRAPYDHWTFVAYGSMTRPDVYRHRYEGGDIQRVYGASRYTGTVRCRNGVAEAGGPDREYVERQGNVRVGTAEIVDVNDYSRVRVIRRGERDRIEAYRPQIRREATGRTARPDRVTRIEHTPSIESRYLDPRMRPEVRDDDRGRVGKEREAWRDQPDLRQRPTPRMLPQEHQHTVPRANPGRRDRPVPDVRPQDRRQGGSRDVRSSGPGKTPAPDVRPVTREASNQRESRPEVLRDSPRPDSRTRGWN